MLTGAHVLIYSSNSQADKEFFRDVLGLPYVDAGNERLMFGLPPSEVAFHETDGQGGKHEMYLICDDVQAFVAAMADKHVACEPVAERGWGSVTSITLPSGITVGVYQAHHVRPVAKKGAGKALRETARRVRKATKKAKKVAKKAAKKVAKPAKAAKAAKAAKPAKPAKKAKPADGVAAAQA